MAMSSDPDFRSACSCFCVTADLRAEMKEQLSGIAQHHKQTLDTESMLLTSHAAAFKEALVHWQ